MIKFKYVVLIVLLSNALHATAQKSKRNKLVGIWQVGSAMAGDAMHSNYRFFSDGTFKYTFNQYDDRGRIMAAKGNYKLKADTLYLIIKTRTERIGGDLVGGSPGFQQEELVLEGDKMVEIKQKNQSPIPFVIKWFKKNGTRGFELQNNKYYLVSANLHSGD